MGEVLGLGTDTILGMGVRVKDRVTFKGRWDVIIVLQSSIILLERLWFYRWSETEIGLLIFLIWYNCVSGICLGYSN